MELDLIIRRLREACPPRTFRLIGGSADLEGAMQSVPPTPAAYVVPMADKAEPPRLAGSEEQIVRRHVAVVVCLANAADVTGGAAALGLRELRQAIRGALLGWRPAAEAVEPCVFGSGRFVHCGDGRLWWSDEYSYLIAITA